MIEATNDTDLLLAAFDDTPLAVPQTELEWMRIKSFLKILPKEGSNVLEVGARDGVITQFLLNRFEHVTALDLSEPTFSLPRCATVAGDIRKLDFPDRSFDVVVCTEVLEHIHELDAAAKELARVTRRELIIGVPFEQDLRLDRTTCGNCGRASPAWGHVNSFTERKLRKLFRGMTVRRRTLAGNHRSRTNWLSTVLMDIAGNPWGSYEQREPCLHCGKTLKAPEVRSLPKRILAGTAARLTDVQTSFVRSTPIWIHLAFSRDS